MISETDFISYITVKKGLSQQSIRHCTIRYRVIMGWLEREKKELNTQSVEDFILSLKEKNRSNATLNTYLFCLRYMQDYFNDRGVTSDFLTGIQSFAKKRVRTIEILTVQEIEKYLSVSLEYKPFRGRDTQVLDTIYRTFTMALAFTGARFDEMASIQVKDVDLSWGKITFLHTKNKETRSVYITDPLSSAIKQLIQDKKREDLVFSNMMGHKIRPQEFEVDIAKRKEKAGLTKRIHPHLFRHSFATQLLVSGVDITQVATILGHKDIQTTYENYVHLADESLKKAMYHHPLIRKNIAPVEFLKNIKSAIVGFRLDEDERFTYEMNESNGELTFRVAVKH